ncbi:MAG: hypothetical protein J0H00_06470 [Burkholderiales bacterium]|nr:hypothetical protein [Burkholderiales bacterium]
MTVPKLNPGAPIAVPQAGPMRLAWRPFPEWTEIDPVIDTTTKEALRKVFGEFPLDLSQHDLPELRAMAAVGGAIYGRLCKVVLEHGHIQLSIAEN